MIQEILRDPPGGKPWLLFVALGASLTLNALQYLGVFTEAGDSDGPVAINAPIPPEDVPSPPPPKGAVLEAGKQHFGGVVQSSLSATFTSASTTSSAALTQVFSRLMAWEMDMRRDIHKGDQVDLVFEDVKSGEPLIHAARLKQRVGTKDEKITAAYRFQAPGDRFPSYWDATGQEVPQRLIEGPIDDYEQITSLLRDRPDHEGLDFKTPIGTPITASRAGRVTRVNWPPAGNGMCVEIEFPDGTLARYLHLNEVAVKEGDRVTAGMALGKTGNTGRSTGPHLHYALMKGGRVIDPIEYHGTIRRQLPPEVMADFQKEVEDLNHLLDAQVAELTPAPKGQ